MNKTYKIASTALIALLILGFALEAVMPLLTGNTTTRPTAFERVSKTKILRCGYFPYEPFVSKDPNTGKLSGVTVDYLNAVAQRHGYKVEWTSEVTIDQVVPSLDGGRFDMFCVPCTPNTDYERVVGFSGNLGGLPYYTYVAKKSEMTAETLPTAKFVLHDGFALSEITKTAFPKAQFISLPQTSSMSEFFDQLRFGKADAVVNEHITAENYMKANPDVMRRTSDSPVIAMRMFLVAQKADTKMLDFMSQTFGIEDPANLASMKQMLVKYHVPDGGLLLGDACRPAVSEKGWKICAP